MRIISLSTIPPRFDAIGATLRSLLAQRASIDEIQLCIPRHYRRFPGYDGSLPAVPAGIRIVTPETDLGPASKVLYAAREHRGRDTSILFCDDDRLYAPTWAGGLLDEQERRPRECVALFGKNVGGERRDRLQPRAGRRHSSKDLPYRIDKLRGSILKRLGVRNRPIPLRRPIAEAGYVDTFQGWGGVVVRPDFFDEVAYDIPAEAWAVDDIWLSGMLARRDIPIWLPARLPAPARTDTDRVEALHQTEIEGVARSRANDEAVALMQRRYAVWRDDASPGSAGEG